MLLSQLEIVEETLRFVYNLVYNNFTLMACSVFVLNYFVTGVVLQL